MQKLTQEQKDLAIEQLNICKTHLVPDIQVFLCCNCYAVYPYLYDDTPSNYNPDWDSADWLKEYGLSAYPACPNCGNSNSSEDIETHNRLYPYQPYKQNIIYLGRSDCTKELLKEVVKTFKVAKSLKSKNKEV